MNLPATSFKPSEWWQGLATLSETEAAAADATAWSLVALLVFCTVCFLGGALVLRKRETYHLPDQESETSHSHHAQRPESSKKSETKEEDPKRQPWERGADWWKDQG